MDLGKNHQVLAYAYDDNGHRTTVSVYDSNVPDTEVTIAFDTSHPQRATTFDYSGNDETLFGFFTVPYTPADPSPLFSAA
jgi:YD repeat-containing protein